jgi:glutaminase
MIDGPALQSLLTSIHARLGERWREGRVADYIPQLSGVPPDRFGMALALLDGRVMTVGDADEPFSIQSISKIFSLTLALGRVGENLWFRVGREPSGLRFNSIIQLEYENGIPRNPFINAGAIVVVDVIAEGHEPKETLGEFLMFVRHAAGHDDIVIDKAVAASEKATGHANLALAHFLKAHGNLRGSPERVLGVYFHQCALAMSCRQLASSALFLANSGRHPITGYSVISPLRARRINALMMTCGTYDAAGDFAFRIGLPAKSGVGGGILAVVPGVGTIAVWGPALDRCGNSVAGSWALEELVAATDWSVFGKGERRG